MAHECPVCGLCYCGGDIDDYLFNTEKHVDFCTCCEDDDGDDWEEYEKL